MQTLNSNKLDENNKKVLKERAERLARLLEVKNLEQNLIEIFLFKLDRENFALETKYVKEICSLRDYTPLTCAPAFVYGLTNVRRRILPIIDLKVFFSLPNDENIDKQILVFKSEDTEFAILIDGFSSIRTISIKELKTSLPTLTGIRQEFLKGLIADGTVVLDGKKILSSPYLVLDMKID